MLKLLNIKIISLLLITNLITGSLIIKTQSCSNAPIDESKKAAYIAEMKRIRGDTPPGSRTPTIIPGNGTR